MSWQEIQGHESVLEQFRRAVQNRRLASTFLFVGPAGIGKKKFAVKLAQSLLCETNAEEELNACGSCPSCVQVAAFSHPDLDIVGKPDDKSFIPLDVFIGDKEHRMREGLCHRLGFRPSSGKRKIAIIDDADFLNQEGANCLLKTLEEPPRKSVLVLIGTSEQKQLPTIRSRCQIVRFRPLAEPLVAELLVQTGLIDDPVRAEKLAALSGGSLQQAIDLADDELFNFRQQLFEELARHDRLAADFAKTMGSFVDAAGKEAPPRRARLLQIAGFAAEFYRQLMRSLAGLSVEGDPPLQAAVADGQANFQGDSDTAAACLTRCLDAQFQVLANANQATLIECWLDELATMTRTGRVLAGNST